MFSLLFGPVLGVALKRRKGSPRLFRAAIQAAFPSFYSDEFARKARALKLPRRVPALLLTGVAHGMLSASLITTTLIKLTDRSEFDTYAIYAVSFIALISVIYFFELRTAPSNPDDVERAFDTLENLPLGAAYSSHDGTSGSALSNLETRGMSDVTKPVDDRLSEFERILAAHAHAPEALVEEGRQRIRAQWAASEYSDRLELDSHPSYERTQRP